MSIRDILFQGGHSLTPSEEKIVRVLLTDYPTAGLGTATALARRSGVSDPTVVRLVMKLGFEGFPDFQSKLLAEVEQSLHSPLLMMEAKRPEIAGADDAVVAYMRSIAGSVEKAVSATPTSAYERAARLIMENKGRVILVGGRFSRYVSGMLKSYLAQLRPGVEDMEALTAASFDMLVDIGKRDVVVVFDYRRYQFDVVSFAEQAAERGARIVLFTDPWLSPIASVAEVVINSPVETASPYDTLAPAVAQVEAFVAYILSSRGEGSLERIGDIESIRRANAVTLDNSKMPAKSRDVETADGASRRKPMQQD